jgi:hypothetical protein
MGKRPGRTEPDDVYAEERVDVLQRHFLPLTRNAWARALPP